MVRSSLSAADSARLDTWMVEIADAEIGHAHAAADGFRAGHTDGLVIHRTGVFHDFRDGGHGRGGLALLRHLRGLDHDAGVSAAREWLADHAGEGRFAPTSDSEDTQADNDAQRQAYIDALWNGAAPLAPGQAAMTYLTATRGLTVSPADMAGLRWIENYRGDEGVLLVADTDNDGGLVAIQRTFITPAGQKTQLGPPRITERGPHDWARRGMARFGDGEHETLYLTEGVEDALTVRMAVEEPVAATLGVGNIGRAKLPAHVKRVIIVRDGNPDGHAADKGLWRGVARLMGQRVEVLVTQRPARVFGKSCGLEDANDVLLAHGVDGVRKLLATASATPDELDAEVVLDGLSRLDNQAYDHARKQAADKLAMRLGTLDAERDGTSEAARRGNGGERRRGYRP